MIISITGTPGTGKTAAAEILSKKLDANLISIKHLVDQNKISYSIDKKRNTKVVDVKKAHAAVKESLSGKVNIIDSHFSHFFKSDFIFVLRTSPDILNKRLKKRKWSLKKIKENIEAEILDEITIESVYNNKKVFEIDTTKISAEKTAGIMVDILKNPSKYKKYRAGKIDWTKKYFRYLL